MFLSGLAIKTSPIPYKSKLCTQFIYDIPQRHRTFYVNTQAASLNQLQPQVVFFLLSIYSDMSRVFLTCSRVDKKDTSPHKSLWHSLTAACNIEIRVTNTAFVEEIVAYLQILFSLVDAHPRVNLDRRMDPHQTKSGVQPRSTDSRSDPSIYGRVS